MLLLQSEFLIGGIDYKFHRLFSFTLWVHACSSQYISMSQSWLEQFSTDMQQLSSVSLGRCEEARNKEKSDVCWKNWQGWSKSPFTTNLCFFGRILLINISLIPKLDASIRGLLSINIQNSRKQICSPYRGTKSESHGWFHTARLETLQDTPGFLGWKLTWLFKQ